jgi:hypothetical protein
MISELDTKALAEHARRSAEQVSIQRLIVGEPTAVEFVPLGGGPVVPRSKAFYQPMAPAKPAIRPASKKLGRRPDPAVRRSVAAARKAQRQGRKLIEIASAQGVDLEVLKKRLRDDRKRKAK